MPRAGSPSYWAPRLVVHPSLHEKTTSSTAFCHSDPHAEKCSQITAKPIPQSRGTGSHPPTEGRLSPHSCIQAGERSLEISRLRCCEGKSYSGLSLVQPDIHIRAIHYNGRHPSFPEGDQDIIYMMTCSPLLAPKGLKVILREGISKLCPPGSDNGLLRGAIFFLGAWRIRHHGPLPLGRALGGIGGAYAPQRRPLDLLCQPIIVLEIPVTTVPWLEPPFTAPSATHGLDTPIDQRTPGEVADLLKARSRPALVAGKKSKEVRWVTTCLISNPTE